MAVTLGLRVLKVEVVVDGVPSDPVAVAVTVYAALGASRALEVQVPSAPRSPATLRPLASATVTSPSVPVVALTTTGSAGQDAGGVLGRADGQLGGRRRSATTTRRTTSELLEPATLSVAGLSTLPEQPATQGQPPRPRPRPRPVVPLVSYPPRVLLCSAPPWRPVRDLQRRRVAGLGPVGGPARRWPSPDRRRAALIGWLCNCVWPGDHDYAPGPLSHRKRPAPARTVSASLPAPAWMP